MNAEALAALVADDAGHLGISLDAAVADALARYALLVEKWARRINLTATREAGAFLRLHVVDALAIVPHLPEHARRLVDVGSGAGIPGVVLAAARPSLTVVALEPNKKKCAFLSAARREFGVANLFPVSQRFQEYLAADGFESADVAVSRATLDLPAWLTAARSLVERGRIIGMEGAHEYDLPEGARRIGYALPAAPERTRSLIVIDVA